MDMANLNLDNLKYQTTTSQLKVIIRKIQKNPPCIGFFWISFYNFSDHIDLKIVIDILEVLQLATFFRYPIIFMMISRLKD